MFGKCVSDFRLAATNPKYTHDGLIAFEEEGDATGLPAPRP